MLKETEETLGFVVIIFVISGIQLGPPPYAYGAEQVDATEMYHERGSLPINDKNVTKKPIVFSVLVPFSIFVFNSTRVQQ